MVSHCIHDQFPFPQYRLIIIIIATPSSNAAWLTSSARIPRYSTLLLLLLPSAKTPNGPGYPSSLTRSSPDCTVWADGPRHRSWELIRISR